MQSNADERTHAGAMLFFAPPLFSPTRPATSRAADELLDVQSMLTAADAHDSTLPLLHAERSQSPAITSHASEVPAQTPPQQQQQRTASTSAPPSPQKSHGGGGGGPMRERGGETATDWDALDSDIAEISAAAGGMCCQDPHTRSHNAYICTHQRDAFKRTN